ncbi:MAG TPA: hypothetical protein VIX11_00790 [Candidatus Acidoferrum sp.]
MVLLTVFVGGLPLDPQRLSAAQAHANAMFDSSSTTDETVARDNERGPPTPSKMDEMVDQIFKREHVEIATIEQYVPTIETYIQEVKFNQVTGAVPKSDYYFLGQADFGGRLKVHSMTGNSRKGSLMWSFEPAGFLQMIYIDRGEFDKAHYKLKYSKREFLGEVRCIRFEVSPTPNTRGPRFVGNIWVEDQDYTVVRISGTYAPSIHFSLKTFEDEYYLHFESWRTNVKSGLWLPSYVYSQELHRPTLFGNPSYKSSTHLWGYKLKKGSREEEMSRLLVESAGPIRDEATQHARSPLEAQREWRYQAENNVLDLLERDGLLAPQRDVDMLLNTVVNNLEVTNNVDEQIDLGCRVLLTNTLEMFSIGNTLVLSRGLIDVMPNEETLAALIAHAMADAMLPKPNQDQYGFSDILRLSPTEVLRRLSFEEGKIESAQNNEKAMELLKKSPYAPNLGNAGLFLKQLHSQAKELKQLISPQLGNEIYFASQLLQTAPALAPDNKSQIAALPLGSRLKIDPWSAGVTLMKSKPMMLHSGRDKMPFAVTPLVPYLTRYVEASAVQAGSDAAVAFKQ